MATLMITGVVAILLIGAAWQRRAQPGAIPFAVILLIMVVWCGLAIAELRSETFETKYIFFKLRVISGNFYTLPWLLLGWEYLHQQRIGRQQWRMVALLCAIPLIQAVLILTNDSNNILWLSPTLFNYQGAKLVVVDYARGYSLGAFYYTLSHAGVVYLLVQATRRSAGIYRGQGRLLLIGFGIQIIPLMMLLVNWVPAYPLSLTAMFFLPTMIVLAGGLYLRHLFDFSPIARDRLVEAMSNGLLVFDDQNRLIDYNILAETILRQAEPELPVQLLGLGPDRLFMAWPDWAQAAREHDDWKIGITVDRGETQHDYHVRCSILKNRNGKQTGALMLLEDVSDRRVAEERAVALALERKRAQILQTFIQNASHDFRTPISIVKTASYIVGKIGEQIEKQTPLMQPEAVEAVTANLTKLRDRLSSINDSSDRLTSILDDMLEVVRLEGLTDLERRAVNVPVLIQQVVAKYKQRALERKLTLQAEPSTNGSAVLANDEYVQRALQALLDNALQYTPADGTITIRATTQQQQLALEVQDTGCGISPEVLPNIFSSSYRADGARSTETGGAGLGLTLVKRIMELHGGSVEVESEVGQGSIFRLLLPVAEV
ncbi:MAG: histidine kinase N-terminal 7TM domain-containing protein [Anaerolineae bacterium]